MKKPSDYIKDRVLERSGKLTVGHARILDYKVDAIIEWLDNKFVRLDVIDEENLEDFLDGVETSCKKE